MSKIIVFENNPLSELLIVNDKHVENINVRFCDNLKLIRIANCPKLKTINIFDNKNLKKVTLDKIPNVYECIIVDCNNLVIPVQVFENMTIFLLQNIEHVSFSLEYSLPNVEELTLFNCYLEYGFNIGIDLPKLKSLNISLCHLKTLILKHKLDNLRDLNLYSKSLVSLKIKHPLPSLTHLFLVESALENIDIKLDRTNTNSIFTLEIGDNIKLPKSFVKYLSEFDDVKITKVLNDDNTFSLTLDDLETY